MSARNGNPKMQRAHFQLIADVIKDTHLLHKTPRKEAEAKVALAGAFAARLSRCNPQFDWAKFTAACREDEA